MSTTAGRAAGTGRAVAPAAGAESVDPAAFLRRRIQTREAPLGVAPWQKGGVVKLCIVARDDDLEAEHLARVAEGMGFHAARVSFQVSHAGRAAGFDGHAWRVGDVTLDGCDAFIVRRIPASPALLGPPAETVSAAEWFRRSKDHDARARFAWSALIDLELRGRPMVNPLAASGPFDHKPLQLATLLRAGLPVPPTLVTDDPHAAVAFDARWRAVGRQTIIKPAVGGAAARLVDEDARARFDDLRAAPVILQRRAHGRDVRVTVVGDAVVSSVVLAADATVVDFRSTAAWQRGQVAVTPCALPTWVAAASVRAASLCRQVWSGLDWKHDEATDSWELLEANSAPVTLGIEVQTGAPIAAAVVRWLARARGAASSLPSP